MTLAAGTEVGCYRIIGLLGAGGMGEVYRARDTRLGRDVAIKVLGSARWADPERRARFEREARVLAALNHPHIGAIYGIEDAGGTGALVLELIDGPTLADRLDRGPLPVEAALEVALQIAGALEAAHARGIVHRDLKPANVILRGRGSDRRGAGDDDLVVKVVDFGLAKEAAAMDDAGATASPTLAVEATREGMLLGTAAYMSPEQARGGDVDERTDLWAFGCVLYEMLTGRQPFAGASVTDRLAAILHQEPDWSALPAATPSGVRRVLRRALEKDRRRRLQDAGDLRIELEEARDEPPPAAVPGGVEAPPVRAARPAGSRAAVLVGAAVAIAAALAGWWAGRSVASSHPAPVDGDAVARPELRLEISTPPTSDPVSLAISPDGKKLAFVATSEGRSVLWTRSLDSTTARPLAGTEGASLPFWSPDGRAIAFFADRKLKRIDVEVGAVQVLARAAGGRGGTWGPDGTIVFQPSTMTYPLMRIAASGGDPAVLESLLGRFPQFLPDGVHFLFHGFTGETPTRGVFVGAVDGSAPRRLLDADAAAVYASGHLLFVRGTTLLAQPFDPSTLTLSGSPFPLAAGMIVNATLVAAPLSASIAGPIVFRSGAAGGRRRLVWVDRAGRELERVGDLEDVLLSPSLSPDGSRVAFHRTVDGSIGIWLIETARGVIDRLTTEPTNEYDPTWSPDGTRIVYTSGHDLIERPIGGGEPRVLLETTGIPISSDWSPDGRHLLYYTFETGPGDLWVATLDGTEKPLPLAATDYHEIDGQFSPDGQWIAYTSDESGEPQVYLRRFQGASGKLQVSTAGGAMARFSRDGGELFYVALDGKMMAVALRRSAGGTDLEPLAPTPLFDTDLGELLPPNSKQQYMVAPDGRRFLLDTLIEEHAPPITVVVNWSPPS